MKSKVILISVLLMANLFAFPIIPVSAGLSEEDFNLTKYDPKNDVMCVRTAGTILFSNWNDIERIADDELGFNNRSFFKILSDGDGLAIRNAFYLMLEDLGIPQYHEVHKIDFSESLLQTDSKDTQPIFTTEMERRFQGHVPKGLTFFVYYITIP